MQEVHFRQFVDYNLGNLTEHMQFKVEPQVQTMLDEVDEVGLHMMEDERRRKQAFEGMKCERSEE